MMMHIALLSLLLFVDQPAKKIVKVQPQKWRRTQVTYRQPSRPKRSHEDYVHLSRETEKIVAKAMGATANEREKSDLRAIQFSLSRFNEAVSAGNYSEADSLWDRMQATWKRVGGVASVAQQRKEAWARAEEERRHREMLEQRERQHRRIINELQRQHNQWRFR